MAARMARSGKNTGLCLWTSVQVRAEKHVKRNSGEILDGKQEVARWQVFAGFPMAPGGGGNAELGSSEGDIQVLGRSPVPQPCAERDARGVMVMAFSGVHGRKENGVFGRRRNQPFNNSR